MPVLICVFSFLMGRYGSGSRVAALLRPGSHPMPGDRPGGRGPADRAGGGSGRPARWGFLLAHAPLGRPAAGGSPLRKTPDRHQVGASVRGAFVPPRTVWGCLFAEGPICLPTTGRQRQRIRTWICCWYQTDSPRTLPIATWFFAKPSLMPLGVSTGVTADPLLAAPWADTPLPQVRKVPEVSMGP